MRKSFFSKIGASILLLILASCSQSKKAQITIEKESARKIFNNTTRALEKKYNIKNLDVALLYNLDNPKADLINKDYVNIINNSKYNKNFLALKHNFNKTALEQNAKIRLQQLQQIFQKLKQNNVQIAGLKSSKNPKYFNTLANLHHKHAKFLPILFPSTSRCITSHYGVRMHPIQKKKIFHRGIDIASQNRLIFSAGEGIVEKIEIRTSGYGNNITIDHANGVKTFYAHLSKILVSPKQKVLQGELIGVEGSTGNATGVHLHFETRYNGCKVNPMLFFIAA